MSLRRSVKLTTLDFVQRVSKSCTVPHRSALWIWKSSFRVSSSVLSCIQTKGNLTVCWSCTENVFPESWDSNHTPMRVCTWEPVKGSRIFDHPNEVNTTPFGKSFVLHVLQYWNKWCGSYSTAGKNHNSDRLNMLGSQRTNGLKSRTRSALDSQPFCHRERLLWPGNNSVKYTRRTPYFMEICCILSQSVGKGSISHVLRPDSESAAIGCRADTARPGLSYKFLCVMYLKLCHWSSDSSGNCNQTYCRMLERNWNKENCLSRSESESTPLLHVNSRCTIHGCNGQQIGLLNPSSVDSPHSENDSCSVASSCKQ